MDVFAQILMDGFGIPEGALPGWFDYNRIQYADQKWSLYLAAISDTPVACGPKRTASNNRVFDGFRK